MKRFIRITHLIFLPLVLLIVPSIHAQDSSDQILYQVGNGDASSVYRLNLEDGTKTQVGVQSHTRDEIRWSPAGKFITLLTFDDPNSPTLTLIDAETGHSQLISDQLDFIPCTFPFTWSHDDEWLSYMVQSQSNPVRKILNLTKGTVQVLTDVYPTYDDMLWSADNRYLAYNSLSTYAINPVSIWDMQNQKTLAVFNVESPQFLKWSPAENLLAFIDADSHNVSIYNPADDTAHEYNASVIGDWSPNGKFLTLYRRKIHDQMTLLVLDILGEKLIQLDKSIEDADTATASWSPDSHYLAMTIRTGKKNKVWILDIQTEHLYDTTLTTREYERLVWSPAGNQLAFPSDQDIIGAVENFTSLWVFEADHQQKHHYDVQIPLRVHTGKIEWSPNGRYLTVQLDNDPVLLDWKTGAINTVIKSFKRLRWSPDGTKLALTSYKEKMPDIYIFGSDGNTLQNVTNTPAEAEYFIGWRGAENSQSLFDCGVG